MRRITLLTDFGTRDAYVGAMKGAIASIIPDVALEDVAHDLPPGDVGAASRALARYWRRFPPGTVHLVVVDPGVGTDRRALAIQADGRWIVAADNGGASAVLHEAEAWRAVSLENREFHGPARSRTFHGRDVFAPVAAHLAGGLPLDRLGPEIRDPVRLVEPAPERNEGEVRGQVVARDRFGNLVTNVGAEELRGAVAVEAAGRRIPVAETYGEVEPGTLLALVNSGGRLELAVRDGSAAELLEGGHGMPVRVLGAGSAPSR